MYPVQTVLVWLSWFCHEICGIPHSADSSKYSNNFAKNEKEKKILLASKSVAHKEYSKSIKTTETKKSRATVPLKWLSFSEI
jgi:hypothetical protein